MRTFKELGVRVGWTVVVPVLNGFQVPAAAVTMFLLCCDLLQVLKERRENKVTTLELSSTFLPQANRNKLLQFILGFTLL